ncbi:MAG: DNA primase [Candidatus Aminicenantaceae bacterium]
MSRSFLYLIVVYISSFFLFTMEIVDQIRQIAGIVDIASQYTTLKKRGKKHIGLCPFHSEKDPSFTVDDEKQLFHCFGCGVGGDVFSLVMEKENLSFPEAIRYLAQKYNIPLPTKRELSPQFIKLEEKLLKINESALAFFKKNLYNTTEGRQALEYLKKRNISEKTIQQLKIGYALNTWTSLLDFFQGKGIKADLLEKAGLALPRQKKEGYYDRFRGRIIFPIFNLTGKVVGFGGRSVSNGDPKYLNSPDTPIYTKGNILYGFNFSKDSVREAGTVIIVEGYTDFAALYQAGITNIAASLGTSLTSRQVSLAFRFAPKIIVNYDSDSAGKAAAQRAISLCFEKGVQIRVLLLPDGLDPDSFLSKHDAEQYQMLLDKSAPGLKFMIDSFLQEGKMDIPEEKAFVVKNVVKEIEKIPDAIVRSEYLKQTSELLSVDEEVLRSIIQQKLAEKSTEERDPFLPAEKRLLQILIENDSIAPHVFAEMKEDDFHSLKGEPIFKFFFNSFKKKNPITFHELNQVIEPKLLSSLSKALLEKGSNPTVNEALDCLYTLRQLYLENRSKELKEEIMRSERKGEKEKITSLLNQRQDIAKKLSLLSKRNYKSLSYDKRDSLQKERY